MLAPRQRARAHGHGSTLWHKDSGRRLHGGLAHTLGLIGHRPHLVLEELGLNLERLLHALGLAQLVTEIKRRSYVALHEIAELLGLIGNRQGRGTQTLFQQAKILLTGLSKAAECL